MSSVRWIFSLIFVFCIANRAMPDRYFTFNRYDVNKGLNSDLVRDIEQDAYGHIWISTDCGLARFDGHSFKQYTSATDPTLVTNDVFHLHSYADGSFFLGSGNGVLLKYNQKTDEFDDYSPHDFRQSYYKEIEGFSQTKDNKKVAFTSGGFYFLDDLQKRFENNFSAYESNKDRYVLSFFEDDFERYWVTSFNILAVMNRQGDVLKSFDLTEDVSSMFSSRIVPVTPRQIYVTCFSDIVYCFEIDESGVVNEPLRVKLPFSNLNNLIIDKNGHFWYTSDGSGLWYSEDAPNQNTVYHRIVPSNCDVHDLEKIYAIKEDDDGNIWIGTSGTGVWMFNPYDQPLLRFSNDVKFPKRMCSSFAEDYDGNLYASCDGGGMIKIYGENPVSYEVFEESANGLTNKNVVSLEKDGKGHFWLATWGGGVLEFDPNSKTFRSEKFDGLKSNLSCFSHVNVMSNGEVWVCTGGDGVYMRDTSGAWHRYVLQFSENEFDMWPSRVVEGRDGTRWISTSRSLWRVNGGKNKYLLSDFSRKEGANTNVIYDMAVGRDGSLFVAIDRRIVRFPASGNSPDTLSFIPSAEYYSLCMDNDGVLHAASSLGLFTIDYERAKCSKIEYDIEPKEVLGFRIHSSYLKSDGSRIWWGTKNGYIVQDIIREGPSAKIKNIRFSDVKIADLKKYEQSRYVRISEDGIPMKIELPYDKSELSVSVDMVDFSETKHDVLYRLSGFYDKWMPLTENRQIKIPYIPSGNYTLEVVVLTGDELLETISLPISILPPWWQSWWFYIIVMVLSLSLIWLIYKIRVRTLKQRQAELQQMVDERTRELDHKNMLIEQQNKELKQVLSDKDRVLSILAHDLKNPMFAIVGALEGWIRREATLSNDEKRSIVSKVLSSSQTLQSEMARLLEWARAKSDKITCVPTDVDLSNCMDNIVSLLSPLYNKKRITFTNECDLKHCVKADGRMLSTILRNFVNNAIKFTPEGGKISVSAREIDKIVSIQIVDTGVGMSDAKRRELVTQGYCDSTLGTDNEKGTGLGFRIALDYIERNSGTFDLQSEEGKGTSIYLTFPLSEVMVSDLRPKMNEEERKIMENSIDREMLYGNRVVVVDDDELICQNVSDILCQYMKVYTAHNGEEALKITQENEIDLVLSDVEMPVMNGIELSRTMARSEKTDFIPFLFLSAKNEQSDRLLGLLSGAVDYIPKPFSTSELLIKVNNILRVRQKQQKILLQNRFYNNDIQFNRGESDEKPERMNPFVVKLMEEIEGEYAKSDFSIESLAANMNMSQSTLSRRTKNLIGKTPVEVLNEYRLNKAYRMLKEKNREENIASVAYEVGFSDPAYFTRKFKEFFGFLPSSVK